MANRFKQRKVPRVPKSRIPLATGSRLKIRAQIIYKLLFLHLEAGITSSEPRVRRQGSGQLGYSWAIASR